MKSNRAQIRNAKALCHCGSHDIGFVGYSVSKWDCRPVFKCGSCFTEWTNGTDGEPYFSVSADKRGFYKDTGIEVSDEKGKRR